MSLSTNCRPHNKRLHLTIASVASCADAQAAPAALAGEANVRWTWSRARYDVRRHAHLENRLAASSRGSV